jgi:hypothetical protein
MERLRPCESDRTKPQSAESVRRARFAPEVVALLGIQRELVKGGRRGLS